MEPASGHGHLDAGGKPQPQRCNDQPSAASQHFPCGSGPNDVDHDSITGADIHVSAPDKERYAIRNRDADRVAGYRVGHGD